MNKLLLENAYNGKKVFLTGHTGFKGSWLLLWLNLLGAKVKGYALAPEHKDDLFNLLEGDSLGDSVIADIKEKETLREAIISFEPDFVFHLAAQPLVRLSYDIPSETFAVNAIGTAHVLDGIRELNKPCVGILITTDKVYENKEWVFPYRENDRLGGYDPYSASKACAELVINAYNQSFFNLNNFNQHQKAIASARAGNVIGGGDWAKDRIIPDIIRALQEQKIVPVRNPNAVRPWQHVLEPLGGYLLLGARLATEPVKFSGAWNFGPLAEDNKRVEELVQAAIKIWGAGDYEKANLGNQPHEAGLLKLDISKAISILHWKPKWGATEAIEKTIEWYRFFINNPNGIKAFTSTAIEQYMSL